MAGYKIDIATWSRREHYHFFSQFDLPSFGFTVAVPVTATLRWCKLENISFSLACWYFCQQAANAVENFRYRIREDCVWVHDQIQIGTTIFNKETEKFRYCYYPYSEDFETFYLGAKAAINAEVNDLNVSDSNDARIHGSTVPWIHFTALQHPRQTKTSYSVPRVVFGKYQQQGEELMMPVSVEAHHALMDGFHISQFIELLTQHFSEPSKYLTPINDQL